MGRREFDLLIVGGGLSGTLLALALREFRPELSFLLIERNQTLGGNHTWSFHETDLSGEELAWIYPYVSSVNESHEVKFPKFSRAFASRYYSIASSDFHEKAVGILQEHVLLNADCHDLTPTSVRVGLDTMRAKLVVNATGDATGAGQAGNEDLGYQKFLGQVLVSEQPHGLTHAVLMDARVDQSHGFHFMYAIPFSDRKLLLEDTFYSELPTLDIEASRKTIQTYAALTLGWSGFHCEREEQGVLPIPMSAVDATRSGTLKVGMASGLFHPTTGYSLPLALRLALKISTLPTLNPDSAAHASLQIARRLGFQPWFFRLLNRMLFQAAEPKQRYVVFQRFYSLSQDLISRFYSMRMRPRDALRVLVGRPPVPIGSATVLVIQQILKPVLGLFFVQLKRKLAWLRSTQVRS